MSTDRSIRCCRVSGRETVWSAACRPTVRRATRCAQWSPTRRSARGWSRPECRAVDASSTATDARRASTTSRSRTPITSRAPRSHTGGSVRRGRPGAPIVRVYTPTVASDGWDAPHTLDRHRQRRHAVPRRLGHDGARPPRPRHPPRGPPGARRATRPPTARSSSRDDADAAGDVSPSRGSTSRSTGRRPPTCSTRCATDLELVLGDVRAATGDWLKMLAAVDRSPTTSTAAPPPIDRRRARRRPGAAALDGRRSTSRSSATARTTSRTTPSGGDMLRAVAGSGLGILRNRPARRSGPHRGRCVAELLEAARARSARRPARRRCSCSPRPTRARPCTGRPTSTTSASSASTTTGNVIGEHRFLGLYTSSAYTSSPIDIPVLRRKVSEVLSRARFAPASHDYKDLIAILESYPRDDLFQISADDLFDIAMGILRAAGTPAGAGVRAPRAVRPVRVVPRVRAPRPLQHDGSPAYRRRAPRRLRCCRDTNGTHACRSRCSRGCTTCCASIPERSLDHTVDVGAVEAQVTAAARAWTDDLRDALIGAFGEEEGLDLMRAWGNAFPAPPIRRTCSRPTFLRISRSWSRSTHRGARPLAARLAGGTDHLDFQLYGLGAQPSLSEVLPRLTNLGVTVDDEHPYTISTARPARALDQAVPHARPDRDAARRVRPLRGRVPRNLRGRQRERRVQPTRAVRGPLVARGRAAPRVQPLPPPGRHAVQPDVHRHDPRRPRRRGPQARRALRARHDPARPAAPTTTDPLVAEITGALDAIASLDEDRILRALLALVLATCGRTGSKPTPKAGPARASS